MAYLHVRLQDQGMINFLEGFRGEQTALSALRRRTGAVSLMAITVSMGFDIHYSLFHRTIKKFFVKISDLFSNRLKARPMSCGVATSCIFKNGYAKCCTNLNTASCFTDIPTICLDSALAKSTALKTQSIAW